MMNSEVDFPLSHTIEYTLDGQTAEADHVTLIAPKMSQDKFRTKLKQGVTRAVLWIQEQTQGIQQAATASQDEQQQEDETDDGEMIMMAIYACPDLDVVDLKSTFIELMMDGACLIGGKRKLTKSLLDEFQPDDVDGMMGAYLGNFVIASMMN